MWALWHKCIIREHCQWSLDVDGSHRGCCALIVGCMKCFIAALQIHVACKSSHLGYLLQVPGLLRVFEVVFGQVVVRITTLVLGVVFILHICGCIFHFTALLNEQKSTWIEASGIVNSESILDRYTNQEAITSGTIVVVKPAYVYW
jgi:hypothetical protein